MSDQGLILFSEVDRYRLCLSTSQKRIKILLSFFCKTQPRSDVALTYLNDYLYYLYLFADMNEVG